MRGDDRGSDKLLETLAAIRRGVPGVTRPARGRHEISAAAAQRISSWIEAGTAVHSSERGGPGVARDRLRGLDLDEVGWWMIPLAANSEALGVLLIATRASVREL